MDLIFVVYPFVSKGTNKRKKTNGDCVALKHLLIYFVFLILFTFALNTQQQTVKNIENQIEIERKRVTVKQFNICAQFVCAKRVKLKHYYFYLNSEF